MRHESTLSHPNLVVRRNMAGCRERTLTIVQGVGPPDRTLRINDPDIGTLRCALLERMFYCKVDGKFEHPPVVELATVNQRLGRFRNRLVSCFGHTATPVVPEEFVEMYKGRKRTVYMNALEEYYTTGLTRKHARCTAFVKCEKVNPASAPRCIQPRSPVYNIALGVYLKPIEEEVYGAIKRVFKSDSYVVLKGLNVEQIAVHLRSKWDEFVDPVAIGLDATKFDMHVSRAMLQWEHSVYMRIFNSPKDLDRVLKMQLDNVGLAYCEDGELRYKVSGRRFSGDMNTALGNCMVMCGMVWSYARHRQVHIQLANNGDDCVVFLERRHLKKFETGFAEWFLELGFRMKVEEPVYVFEQIEFCQMHPVKARGTWLMCRNFERAREKDSMCLHPLPTSKALEAWLYAVGEGGLALTGGVPVFQSFYKLYMRSGKGRVSKLRDADYMASGVQFLMRGLSSKEHPISAEARVSFFEAFDVTPDEQVALEKYYDSLEIFFEVTQLDDLEDVESAPF